MTITELLEQYNRVRKSNGQPVLKVWKASKQKLMQRIDAETPVFASAPNIERWAQANGHSAKTVRQRLRRKGLKRTVVNAIREFETA